MSCSEGCLTLARTVAERYTALSQLAVRETQLSFIKSGSCRHIDFEHILFYYDFVTRLLPNENKCQ